MHPALVVFADTPDCCANCNLPWIVNHVLLCQTQPWVKWSACFLFARQLQERSCSGLQRMLTVSSRLMLTLRITTLTQVLAVLACERYYVCSHDGQKWCTATNIKTFFGLLLGSALCTLCRQAAKPDSIGDLLVRLCKLNPTWPWHSAFAWFGQALCCTKRHGAWVRNSGVWLRANRRLHCSAHT